MILNLNRRQFESDDSGWFIINDEPAMTYLLLKIINPNKSIGVSNLKDEIEKATLAKFVNNIKQLLMECPQITESI